ncbi:contact-dependent growth inhibition system immunity protein [Xanthomonas oryzae pv. oryzicola]|uniref:contact-dependent growth inhibition system immunity protein n=1 Tax=Xanthomonas oryzae TaxID=347 RepID=UPI0009E8EF3F|nr:contact-dependent growth inhibition system immunity protein [Xanthomonas oryzae]
MNSYKMAEICFNGDFYRLITMSKGVLRYADPDIEPKYLASDVDDGELGCALRMTFEASRCVSTEDFNKIFHSGVVQERAKEQDKWEVRNYGYKSKKAMMKNMAVCTVLVGDEIKIQPTHKKSLNGYTIKKDTGPFPLFVPKTATDAELGAALREGFKRCTSSIG